MRAQKYVLHGRSLSVLDDVQPNRNWLFKVAIAYCDKGEITLLASLFSQHIGHGLLNAMPLLTITTVLGTDVYLWYKMTLSAISWALSTPFVALALGYLDHYVWIENVDDRCSQVGKQQGAVSHT